MQLKAITTLTTTCNIQGPRCLLQRGYQLSTATNISFDTCGLPGEATPEMSIHHVGCLARPPLGCPSVVCVGLQGRSPSPRIAWQGNLSWFPTFTWDDRPRNSLDIAGHPAITLPRRNNQLGRPRFGHQKSHEPHATLGRAKGGTSGGTWPRRGLPGTPECCGESESFRALISSFELERARVPGPVPPARSLPNSDGSGESQDPGDEGGDVSGLVPANSPSVPPIPSGSSGGNCHSPMFLSNCPSGPCGTV